MRWQLFWLLLFVPSVAIAQPGGPPDYSPQALKAFAVKTAESHGLNVAHFISTINCESGFAWDAKNKKTFDYGVAQWHLAAHPDISYEQAMDPYWSIERMAEEWDKNGEGEWVCYHLLYK